MIDHNQMRTYVIQPALNAINLWSIDAEELLILTMAQETLGGQFLHQLGGGPALGPWQMEPRSYQDIEDWLKRSKPEVWKGVQDLLIPTPKGDSTDNTIARIYRKFYLMLFDPAGPELMIWNLKFAAAIARCYYLSKPGQLPNAGDVEGMARYYKKYWNTHLGAATVEEAIKNYNKYIG